MGAAIALRIAARHRERVIGLVLARPAWLWDVAPANMLLYGEMAEHLRYPDARQARAAFAGSATAAREAPGNLDTMRKFLDVEDRARLAALLSAISRDGPRIREAEARSIAVPTLAIATGMDIAHPMAFAEILAETVPGARLVEIPPKTSDAPRNIAEFRAALSSFLYDVASSKGPLP